MLALENDHGEDYGEDEKKKKKSYLKRKPLITRIEDNYCTILWLLVIPEYMEEKKISLNLREIELIHLEQLFSPDY